VIIPNDCLLRALRTRGCPSWPAPGLALQAPIDPATEAADNSKRRRGRAQVCAILRDNSRGL